MGWITDLFKWILGTDEEDTPALPASKDDPVEEPHPGEPGDKDIDEAEGHDDYKGLLGREPELKTPDEWSLDVELVLIEGDSGDRVREYQNWLGKVGYELTRFGADGDLGKESLSATREFQDDHGLTEEEDALKVRGVGRKTYDAVKVLFEKIPVEPAKPSAPTILGISSTDLSDGVKLYDITDKHTGKKRKRRRGWKDIKGITLHQTAVQFGNDPMRYRNIAAQVGITPDGKVVLMNDITWIVYHGNAFNSRDVGVEISGAFSGVEGDERTFWKPRSKPNKKPESLTRNQAKATLAAIEWIIREVELHGGNIEYIHAHRQSSKSRTSDPGSKVWQEVALVAKERWGLKDGGPKFKLGGYPIPKEWDPSYTEPYRSW